MRFIIYKSYFNCMIFQDAYSLRFVDLKFNKIADLLEVLNLTGSIFEVDFRGNTCTKWPNYRNVLISSIPSVKFIDGIEVFAEEKVLDDFNYVHKIGAKGLFLSNFILNKVRKLDFFEKKVEKFLFNEKKDLLKPVTAILVLLYQNFVFILQIHDKLRKHQLKVTLHRCYYFPFI